MEKTIFEALGGTCSEVDGVLAPDLELSEADAACLGKWGRMRKRYLKEHRPVLYTNLLLSEKLYPHCAEIECACEERLELIVRWMAGQENVTEALKATDQLEWVRRMSSIQNRAEEIVLHELIYAEETKRQSQCRTVYAISSMIKSNHTTPRSQALGSRCNQRLSGCLNA